MSYFNRLTADVDYFIDKHCASNENTENRYYFSEFGSTFSDKSA